MRIKSAGDLWGAGSQDPNGAHLFVWLGGAEGLPLGRGKRVRDGLGGYDSAVDAERVTPREVCYDAYRSGK